MNTPSYKSMGKDSNPTSGDEDTVSLSDSGTSSKKSRPYSFTGKSKSDKKFTKSESKNDLNDNGNMKVKIDRGQSFSAESNKNRTLNPVNLTKKTFNGAKRQGAKPLKKIHHLGQKATKSTPVLVQTHVGDGAILSGSLKLRDSFKNWRVRYFVLQPSCLHYYKKRERGGDRFIGSIMLKGCEVSLRHSKKEGYCFKIYHPQGKAIYVMKKMHDSVPYSDSYAVLRAPDATEGKAWIHAIKQLCTGATNVDITDIGSIQDFYMSEGESSEGNSVDSDDELNSTTYCRKENPRYRFLNKPGPISSTYNEGQRKDVWECLREFSPGERISSTQVPSFINEPRSLLERISDMYSHVDILSQAAVNPEPIQRLILVTKWYLSGLYQKSKSVSAPISPILGEMYRCCFQHDDYTKTNFVSEQVSTNPPTTAWYCTNRRHGFFTNGNLAGNPLFSGNSVSNELDGQINLRLLRFSEDYIITFPDLVVKGILHGEYTLEISGPVTIVCEKTGYRFDLDFRLKSQGNEYNALVGRLKSERGDKDTLYTLQGTWDQKVEIVNQNTKAKQILWSVDDKTTLTSRPKLTVLDTELSDKDSEKVWEKVFPLLLNEEFQEASQALAEVYDKEKEREKEFYTPRLFHNLEDNFIYRCINLRPWNDDIDEYQYEHQGIIYTETVDGPVAGDDGVDTPVQNEVNNVQSVGSMKDLSQRRNSKVSGALAKEIKTDLEFKENTQIALQKLQTEIANMKAMMVPMFTLVLIISILFQMFILPKLF